MDLCFKYFFSFCLRCSSKKNDLVENHSSILEYRQFFLSLFYPSNYVHLSKVKRESKVLKDWTGVSAQIMRYISSEKTLEMRRISIVSKCKTTRICKNDTHCLNI